MTCTVRTIYSYLAPDDFEDCTNRLGIVALSDIILKRSACRAFLSATGPDAKGEADLARLALRPLEEDENGEVCRLELKFGEEGECIL